jgi:hypothetical protein
MTGDGSYDAVMTVTKAGCPDIVLPKTLNVSTAEPWMMTARGDVYASDGYDLKLQQVTGYSVPKMPPSDDAYFSTYIISRNMAGGWPDPSAARGSLRGYLLGDYDDKNTSKLGAEKVYNYMRGIVEANGRTITPLPPGGPPTSCSGGILRVYFTTSTIDFTDADYGSAANSACVYVTSGDVNVGPNVQRIEGFILADGNFVTSSSNKKLRIDGGVISSNVNFGRDLDIDSTDPAEIIIYDAKYLMLLRDWLGESYPFRIREYKYGSN